MVQICNFGTPVGSGVLLGIMLIFCVLSQICDFLVVSRAIDSSRGGVANISDGV